MRLDPDRIRIEHIIRAAEEALTYAEGKHLTDLESDRPLQHLFVRNLEIIGEAASRITPATRESLPDIPWTRMIAMCNRLVHAYFSIDIAIIMETVTRALPPVLSDLRRYLER